MTNQSPIIRSMSFAAVAYLALPIAAMADEKVQFKAKFPEGRQRYVEVSRETDQVVRGGPMAGGEMKLTVTTIDGVIEKVITSSKKRVELALTAERKAMRLTHPALGRHAYDTDLSGNDASRQLRGILAPALGMTLTLKMDRAYRNASVTGMEAIAEKIAAGVSPGNVFFASIKDELDDANAAADWGERRFWMLPTEKLGVGAIWTRLREESMPSRGGLKYEAKCKFDRLDQQDGRQVAIISYTGTVTADPKAPPKPGSTGLTTSVVEGTFTGTATFDIQRGEITKREETSKTKMEAAFQGGPQKMPAMDVDLTIKTTTKIKSLQDREVEKKLADEKKEEKGKEHEKKTAR